MGLISWIKEKHYQRKYNTAINHFSNGNTKSAIEILSQILEVHVDAPKKLLEVYHSILDKSDDRSILKEIVGLYQTHKELSNECVAFAQKTSKKAGRSHFAALYCSELYKAGISSLEAIFIFSATSVVVSDRSITNLSMLSNSRPLLTSLSASLFDVVKKDYNKESSVYLAYRIPILIEDYIKTPEYKTFLANIRFSIFAKKKITKSSISEFDKLLNDIKNKYNLSTSDENQIIDRALSLCSNLLKDADYTGALLISQRLIGRRESAKDIYSSSAYKLYQNDNRCNLVVHDDLYKALGSKGDDFLKKLEPFVAYGNHSQKYITEARSILKSISQTADIEKGKIFLEHIWSVASDDEYLAIPLTSPDPVYCRSLASYIIESYQTFLNKNHSLTIFLNQLVLSDNSELVLDSLEEMLSNNIAVQNWYVEQVLRFSTHRKGKDQIDLLDRGLNVIDDTRLYESKALALDDYISKTRYDHQYAQEKANQLIGKHQDAEIFLVLIALDLYKKSNTIKNQFNYLNTVVLYKKQHNALFNEERYKSLVNTIQKECESFAETNYNTVHKEKAVAILYLLRVNDFDWYDCYGKLRLSEIDSQENNESTLEELYSVIEEKPSKKCAIESSLWAKAIEMSKDIYSKGDFELRIQGLNRQRALLGEKCKSPNKNDLEIILEKELSKTFLSKGKTAEKVNDIQGAISDYKSSLSMDFTNVESESRMYICKFKLNEALTDDDNNAIIQILNNKSNKKFYKDLAYRYCIYLLQRFEIDTVERINTNVLDDDDEISTLCRDYRIKKQEHSMSEINAKIDAIAKGELSAKDAVTFGQNLGSLINGISLLVHVAKKQSDELKRQIRCYAIKKYYEEENFVEAEAGLKVQDSQYLSDPIELRNIAIMCLMAAEAKQLTDNNYREFLAIWATAIYQQDLFVKSLDYTLWDDPYTFTLVDALGQLENEDLPNNITYDEASGNVISIKDVQKTLVTRMEVALNDFPEYQKFYYEQIDAMEKLSEQNLDEHCVIVAPYLVTMSESYKQNIYHAIETEVNGQYGNWEEVVEIGTLYGLKSGIFGSYQKATEYNQEAIQAINDRRRINSKFTSTRINTIKQFSQLFSSLIAAVSSSLNDDIANEKDYNIIISNYATACKLIESDNLSFTFSNYINQSIVSKLMAKSMDLADGAKTLIDIYPFCQSNPHLKRNLCNIVEALIHSYITEGTSKNLATLDTLLSFSREFDGNVVSALTGGNDAPEELMLVIFAQNESRFNSLKHRIGNKSSKIQTQFEKTSKRLSDVKISIEINQLAEKMSDGSMSKSDGLERIYNIYLNNKSNKLVCEVLAKLVPVCVVEYIIEGKTGKMKVKSVLDKLKTNMSPTFKANNSEIGHAYNAIWNQLDYSTQMALLGTGLGIELTDKGRALKQGIDYLKALR